MQIVKRGTKGKRGFFRKERRRRPASQHNPEKTNNGIHLVFSTAKILYGEIHVWYRADDVPEKKMKQLQRDRHNNNTP